MVFIPFAVPDGAGCETLPAAGAAEGKFNLASFFGNRDVLLGIAFWRRCQALFTHQPAVHRPSGTAPLQTHMSKRLECEQAAIRRDRKQTMEKGR